MKCARATILPVNELRSNGSTSSLCSPTRHGNGGRALSGGGGRASSGGQGRVAAGDGLRAAATMTSSTRPHLLPLLLHTRMTRKRRRRLPPYNAEEWEQGSEERTQRKGSAGGGGVERSVALCDGASGLCDISARVATARGGAAEGRRRRRRRQRQHRDLVSELSWSCPILRDANSSGERPSIDFVSPLRWR
jgi:hypothetical protein